MFPVNMEQLNPVNRTHRLLLNHTLLLFSGKVVKKTAHWLQIWSWGTGARTNFLYINDLLLAVEQRSVGTCETKLAAAAKWESRRAHGGRGDDLQWEFEATRPNEAWFTNVIALLLLAIMRVRLLGYPALIILIRNQERENVQRSCRIFLFSSLFVLLLAAVCSCSVNVGHSEHTFWILFNFALYQQLTGAGKWFHWSHLASHSADACEQTKLRFVEIKRRSVL